MDSQKPVEPQRTLLIAEVGSNHMGNRELARASILAAREAGADVVKFQLYHADRLVDADMPVLKYVPQTHKTQRERFKSLELGEAVFADLASHANEAAIEFMVTPFDEDAVRFLDPLVRMFKVASGDLTNLPLLRAVANTGKPILLSTGLSSLDEIDWAVRQLPRDRLTLLHCVGAYPTPDDQVNLRTIPFLSERFGIPVGFSDHSVGTTACVAAVALGAVAIEKHFLPREDLTPADRALSIGPADFRGMRDDIRRIECMRGAHGKQVQADELYFQKTLRRSLYARVDIAAGEAIRADWLVPLRPWSADAVSPMRYDDVCGRQARRPIAAGKPIYPDDLK